MTPGSGRHIGLRSDNGPEYFKNGSWTLKIHLLNHKLWAMADNSYRFLAIRPIIVPTVLMQCSLGFCVKCWLRK
ncbi:hypothetical protein MARINOS108_11941 [Marinoscillum sp. 108]|nr:hypothetical protein MARINOS108_11941 [Marinoscillum sp. 108]